METTGRAQLDSVCLWVFMLLPKRVAQNLIDIQDLIDILTIIVV